MDKSYSIELPNQLTAGGDSGDDMPIDFKSIIGTVYRRFWLILIAFLTTFLLIAFYTFSQTPTYKAKSVVIVDTTERNVIDLGSVLQGLGGDTAVIDTEVQVMASKSLLTRVAKKQKLIEDPEFNVLLREQKVGLMGGLKNTVRSLVGGDEAGEADPLDLMSETEREAHTLENVVRALMRNVSVNRVGTTYLITAEVVSESPETAARLANAIAEEYRVEQLEAKLDATTRATSWLSERVEGLRDEVTEKEQRIQEYRIANKLDQSLGTSTNEQKISLLQGQLIQRQAELSDAKAKYDSVQSLRNSGAGPGAVAEVLSNATISDLKSQRATAARRVADLETTYGPRHPELLAARNELSEIERQLNTQVSQIVASLRSNVQRAQQNVNDLNRQIGGSRSVLVSNNRAQVRLNELERDADTSRVIYEEFVSRFKQTREQDDLVQADARILSTASVPENPSSPKTLLNLILGGLLGALIGGGMAILAEMFDAQISSADDVERKLGASPIGSIPMIRNQGFLGLSSPNPSDFMVDNPLSAYSESIRYLRAAIAFSDLDSETKTVAITSSLPDEGKTSLTLSLGRMSAMSGSRTLVIDGDFRRRQLTDAAKLTPEIGFVEHLFGAGALDEAIHKDSKSALDILPLSKSGHTPHDVFGTRAFDDLLSTLRERYDLILVDTGPLLLMAEARVVAGKMDKTILIVRWRHSSRSAARQSLNLLRSFKADLLGVALNMVDLNRRRHHKDPGATYKAYKKYYTMDSKRPMFGAREKFGAVRRDPSKRTGPFPYAASLLGGNKDEKPDDTNDNFPAE